jgi:endo-1,4-beta-xylanase
MAYSQTRRAFTLSAASVMGILARPRAITADGDPQSLAEAGRAVGIDIGSAVRGGISPALAAIIARECTLITPENALKPESLTTARGSYHWAEAERIADFARTQGLKLHGHTLFWYKRPLPWAPDSQTSDSLDAIAEIYGEFVGTVMRQFPDAVSWDVLNEIAGTSYLLRDTFPINRHGLDFVERLLRSARDSAPGARLALNENDLECGAGACTAKRKNVLKIVRGLLERGAPLDAIGIQSHLTSYNPPSLKETLTFIRSLEKAGLDVYISEMDVNDAEFDADIERRDTEVATLYRDYLDAVLQSKAVKRVVFWGLADSANWISDGGSRQRRDGKSQRPSLFDAKLDKKPAYYQVMEALRGASSR